MAKSISRYLADISSTSGVLDGTLSTAAQTNITSLGTLSSLTVSGAMNGTLSTAAQPNITSVGTLTTLAMGGNITRTGDLTLDVSGNIYLDADGTNIFLQDGGTSFANFFGTNTDFYIKSVVSDKDMIFQGNDGGNAITALTLDMSEAGAAAFNSFITTTGVYGKGDTNSGIQFDGSDVVTLHTAGAERMRISSGGQVGIGVNSTEGILNLPTNSNLTWSTDYSAIGSIKNSQALLLGNNIKAGATNNTVVRHANGTDAGTFIALTYNKGVTFHTGITTTLDAEVAETTNERVRIDTTGNVGIGLDSPTAKLHIEVADNTEFLKATITGNEAWAFKGASGSGAMDYVSFGISGGTQAMTWQEGGNVGIGTNFTGGNASSIMTAPLNIKLTSGSTAPIVTLNLEHSNNTSLVEQRIQFNIGDDGTADSYSNAGYIAVGKANAYVTDDTRDSYLSFATAENAVQSEKMRIDHNGVIRIGTHAQLSHPNTYSYQTLKVQNSGDVQACLDLHKSDGNKVGTFYGDQNHNQGFLSSTYGWVLKVDNSGNVMPTGYIGLGGSASPSNNCQLSHPSTSTWQTLKIKNIDDSTQVAIEMHSSQDTKRCIVYGATDYYGFLTQSAGWSLKGDSSGNWVATGTITGSSDIRLKEKINTIPNALEKVTKLRGVEYTRISTQEKEIGVIAQEVKEVVPELVSITDGRTEADPDALQDLHTMKYQNTVALLIEAIKELKAEVDELKGKK